MMRRIALYISLAALALGVGGASLRAQTARPNFSGLAKKLEKSDAKIADEKKSVKVGTWLDRGNLLVDIARAHTLNTQPGWDAATIQLTMGRPEGQGQEEVNGTVYNVLRYGEVDLYLNENQQLVFTRVVKPVVMNPLGLAYDSYVKAANLDVKGKSGKKIGVGLLLVHDMLLNEGVNFYSQGKYGDAAEALEKSIEVGRHSLVNATDTLALYYAGLARYQHGEKEKALRHFREAIDAGYTSNGEIICTHYQVAKEVGKVEEGRELVEASISKFSSQKCLMLSLVDYYVSQGKDPKEALPYLEKAIASDPNNAELYFVKGVVLQNLNDEQGALAAYDKAVALKPDYVDPVYSVSVMYFNAGVDLQKRAIDDGKKYDEYMRQADVQFKKSIPAAEKALAMAPGHTGAVDILRTIYFKYRNEPGMQAKLDDLNAKYPK